MGKAGAGEGVGSTRNRGKGGPRQNSTAMKSCPGTGNRLMVHKIGTVAHFHVAERLIRVGMRGCRSVQPPLFSEPTLDGKGRCWPLIGTSTGGPAARATPERSYALSSARIEPLSGNHRAHEPSRYAHPPAPGIKHLMETDGLFPLSHDR